MISSRIQVFSFVCSTIHSIEPFILSLCLVGSRWLPKTTAPYIPSSLWHPPESKDREEIFSSHFLFSEVPQQSTAQNPPAYIRLPAYTPVVREAGESQRWHFQFLQGRQSQPVKETHNTWCSALRIAPYISERTLCDCSLRDSKHTDLVSTLCKSVSLALSKGKSTSLPREKPLHIM